MNWFECIDGHTCGNPCRLVVSGAPELEGQSLAEQRLDFLKKHDWVRKGLMFEPRGHDAMSGVILRPPMRDDCDVGFLFIEVSGCLPMCGHDTIAATTYVIERQLVTPRVPGVLSIETPAGRVDAAYDLVDGRVEQVCFRNVASYLHKAGVAVDVPNLGTVTLDVSYGGNFYAIVEPQATWSGLDDWPPSRLLTVSDAVRTAAQDAVQPIHPEDERIRGVSHVMWCDEVKRPEFLGGF
ncbi:proline racemase family protein [Jannaschia sp. Os4]|nr:proline racemase family protein [Jannaschia sp. Os4]MBM2578143.1 proline racemase family protein [Jannaschia sp. Os4]